jgi:flagellar biogenesis protein FliO
VRNLTAMGQIHITQLGRAGRRRDCWRAQLRRFLGLATTTLLLFALAPAICRAEQPPDPPADGQQAEDQKDKDGNQELLIQLPLLPPDADGAADEELGAGVTATAKADGTGSVDKPSPAAGTISQQTTKVSSTAARKGKAQAPPKDPDLAPGLYDTAVPVITVEPVGSMSKPPAKPAATGKNKPAQKTAADKPAAAKPKTTPQANPAKPGSPATAGSKPAAGSKAAGAASKAGPAATPKSEPATAAEQSGQSLSEYFSADELADPESDSQIMIEDSPLEDSSLLAGQAAADPPARVIRTNSNDGNDAGSSAPTLGSVLSGKAKDSQLGSSVGAVSPWRSLAIVLACLALLFCGMYAAGRLRNPISRLRQHSLNVIETVSIGAGRQLVIVEMNDEALILGVTPHSINMLDKVPLLEMQGSYNKTVSAIIARESTPQTGQWEQRPSFSVPSAAPRLAPPLPQARNYNQLGVQRGSVAELRRAHAQTRGTAYPQTGNGNGTSRSGHGNGNGYHRPGNGNGHGAASSEQRTKAELIGRIRDQLSQLED